MISFCIKIMWIKYKKNWKIRWKWQIFSDCSYMSKDGQGELWNWGVAVATNGSRCQLKCKKMASWALKATEADPHNASGTAARGEGACSVSSVGVGRRTRKTGSERRSRSWSWLLVVVHHPDSRQQCNIMAVTLSAYISPFNLNILR